MILSAGLTPAWQQIVSLDALRVGEVNRARSVHWCALGKVLNVGMALAHFGAPSKTLSLVGGETGASIQREFQEAGFHARWVETQNPTRVCTTVLDSETGGTTELVENTATVTSQVLAEFALAYEVEADAADVVVLSGALPMGTPATFYRDLLRSKSRKSVLDVRGPELLAALECRPFLVKPNREELAMTFGTKIDTDDALLAAMRRLNEMGGEWVVVTQGAQQVWVTWKNAVYRMIPPSVRVVNPIGSGDSMAAGIAWAINSGKDPIESVRLGVAAAVDNLGQLLPARLDPDRVNRIAESLTVEFG